SFSSIWAEPLTPLRLKLATLLFDKLYFMEEERPDWDAHFAELFGGETNVPFPILCGLRAVWSCTNPMQHGFSIYGTRYAGEDKVLDPETLPLPLRQAANNVITPTDEENHYDNYKLKIYSLAEVLWWREKFPDSTLLGAECVEKIIEQATAAEAQNNEFK